MRHLDFNTHFPAHQKYLIQIFERIYQFFFFVLSFIYVKKSVTCSNASFQVKFLLFSRYGQLIRSTEYHSTGNRCSSKFRVVRTYQTRENLTQDEHDTNSNCLRGTVLYLLLGTTTYLKKLRILS